MGWIVGSKRLANTYFLDVDEINDVFRPWTDALSDLNEHNWSESAFEQIVENDLAEPGFAIVTHSVITEREWDPVPGSGVSVRQSTAWTVVPDSEIEFQSAGGSLLIIYSFAFISGTLGQDQSGLNFAIEVDGVPLFDSLLGTGDLSNDFVDKGVSVTGGAGGWTATYGSSPSFKSRALPLRCQTVFKCQPGKHTVKLLARNLYTDAEAYQWIANCEGIVLDMWV